MSDTSLLAMQYALVVVSIAMIASILVQSGSEGLGGVFGGGGGEQFRTKRGMERLLTWATIVLGITFAVLSFLIVKYTGVQ